MEPQERRLRNYRKNGKDLFGEWLDAISDLTAKAAIRARLDRVVNGNFGDHRGVGQEVWELRIHYGPGYRVYYGEDGPVIVLLLCGGDKQTQRRDIRKAQRFWEQYRGLK
ncbi:MAG: type II toxin-antitoxin system RelE/ParE family toxin [Elusimicrobiota bacterium]|nr:type II toxin-antitoxin system RelE/ParE family toxin [Elusimicrobiota bacterium]